MNQGEQEHGHHHLGGGEQLDVAAAAVEPVLECHLEEKIEQLKIEFVLESHLILQNKLLLLTERERALQLGSDSTGYWIASVYPSILLNFPTCVWPWTSSQAQSRQSEHPCPEALQPRHHRTWQCRPRLHLSSLAT